MKALLRLLIATLLLVPAALTAASFEGKVTFKMTSGRDKAQDITYSIKGSKVRMDFPGQKGFGGMLVDTEKKEMIMIMDEQKMYMTMAVPEAAIDRIQEKAGDVQLQKTGETEKILGYTATKYIATQDNTKTDMWLAEGIGTFMGFSSRGSPMGKRAAPPAWERALQGKDLFPLRVIGHDKSGKESFRMEATAIDKTSIPDSQFVPPAGYQKFDMGGMMKGMIPGVGR